MRQSLSQKAKVGIDARTHDAEPDNRVHIASPGGTTSVSSVLASPGGVRARSSPHGGGPSQNPIARPPRARFRPRSPPPGGTTSVSSVLTSP
jgi:hypothetical protein